jgi:glutamyl-tRNA synthetase
MSSSIRVRFAPSPTGPLHIGGVRTALYNYLFAKHHKGTFILRIEDTDQTRFVPKAEEYIIEALKWCGISPDEGVVFGGDFGPYTQSQRRDIYKNHIEQLILQGKVYYAFDTPEELDAKRNTEKENDNHNWQYDASCRMQMRNSLSLSEEETKQLLADGEAYTIRIKMEPNQTIVFEDAIRGKVEVQSNILDDKVLFKSDGLPTYHFANIVDDHLMQISHVIRGEEWLPSTALHCTLYDYMGWQRPIFAHLPLILKPNGKGKLSKRDGDQLGFPVFPLNWTNTDGEVYPGYREQGYDKQAFINMLALLGWNSGTEQELFTLGELVQSFSLEKVNKSGARFDPDKTKWFQQQYLKNYSNEQLLALIENGLPAHAYNKEQLLQICGLLKERVAFANEICTQGAYFFDEPKSYDEQTAKKKWKENSGALLLGLAEHLNNLSLFNAAEIERVFHAFLEKNEIGLGQLMPVFRLALTGLGNGPQLFEIAEVLGKEVCVSRIQKAVDTLN